MVPLNTLREMLTQEWLLVLKCYTQECRFFYSTRLLGRSSSGGSSESRWVYGSEVDWDEVLMWSKHDGKEGYGSIRRRLSKKPKRVDSFDVEAMEIAGTHGHHSKQDLIKERRP